MTERFEIGEVAEYQGLTGNHAKFNGDECVIKGDMGVTRFSDGSFYTYHVKDSNGEWDVAAHRLRKKKPTAENQDVTETREKGLPKGNQIVWLSSKEKVHG